MKRHYEFFYILVFLVPQFKSRLRWIIIVLMEKMIMKSINLFKAGVKPVFLVATLFVALASGLFSSNAFAAAITCTGTETITTDSYVEYTSNGGACNISDINPNITGIGQAQFNINVGGGVVGLNSLCLEPVLEAPERLT